MRKTRRPHVRPLDRKTQAQHPPEGTGKRGNAENAENAGKAGKAGNAGKACGARPAPRQRHRGSAPVPAGGMIPPGPPQFAGQGLSRRTGHPSTRCCFGGSGSARGMPRVIATLFPARRFSGRGNDALCRLWGGQAERGTFRLTARGLPPQCGRVLPDPLTQADSVPACAGPSCQRKDFKTRGR